ncbi:MAG: carboxypeptidase regulatory-like domain-containing protein [Planctomycetes bacterium]|nr:carboxypeptidase regulatory-like domain-containing protein [Planctomycetota bacterium]
MRAFVVGLGLLAGLLSLIGLWWWLGRGAAPSVPQGLAADTPTVRVGTSGNPELEVRSPAPTSPEAAGRPLRYRLVDARNNTPVAGARICRARDGEVLATSDAEGFAEVRGAALNTLVFVADGYLLTHYFDRRPLAEQLLRAAPKRGHVRVLLDRDDLMVPCRLRFMTTAGTAANGVEFQILSLDDPAPHSGSVPTARLGHIQVDPELRAAWQRHRLLGTLTRPRFPVAALHFGRDSRATTYRCDAATTVRFLAGGVYRVDARAAGELAHQMIEVADSGRGEVTVQLRPGVWLTGQVRGGAENRPVGAAMVVALRDGRIVVSGETDAGGRFRLGPTPDKLLRLEVRHQAFEPLVVENVRPGTDAVHVLTPLPEHPVRGVVRRRPARTPVAGAEVRLLGEQGVVVKTRTDASGSFELRSFLIEPTVEVVAVGFLDYQEALNANGSPRTFDLIPAQPEERQRVGLTALVIGTVLDAASHPVKNCPVHVQPVTPWTPSGIEGRRILRGGLLPFQQMVVTGPDGAFRVEWPRSEALRLIAVQGAVTEEQGKLVDVVVGKRHQLVLHPGQ